MTQLTQMNARRHCEGYALPCRLTAPEGDP